jgi:hypothetical protein
MADEAVSLGGNDAQTPADAPGLLSAIKPDSPHSRLENGLGTQSITFRIYLLTVIDSLHDGPFLRAAVRTMQASFAEVKLLSPTSDWQNAERSVYVIAGRGQLSAPVCPGRIDGLLQGTRAHILPDASLRDVIARDGSRGIILTDQYAPVDTLIARRFLREKGAAP